MTFEAYPFWDLVAEESYKYQNPILKEGNLHKFNLNEKEKNVYMFGCNNACRLFIEENNDNYNIVGILDNSPARKNTIYAGKQVYLANEVLSHLNADKDVIVISMRLSGDKIAKQIESIGFHNFYGLAMLVIGKEPYNSLLDMVEEAKSNPIEDYVMFESTNDFDGNSGALYEYLIRNRYPYKYVWIVKDNESKKKNNRIDTVVICPSHSEEDMRQYIIYRARSKWQIWDNNPIRKVRSEQTNVFLQHFGMGYKQVKNIYNSPSYVDYVLTTTELVYNYVKKSLCYAENTKIIYGELPRNDVLFSREWNELAKLTSKKFSKVIMWSPTLRQSNLFERRDSNREYPFGIPLIYKYDELKKLNDFLIEKKILLILKIHPRQKHDYEDICLENIICINEKNNKQIDTYKLMTQVDAMISDYSSIVFDYMLLDRPIAWVLEDLENYQIPLLVDDLEEFMPGYRIYEIDQLYEFMKDISNSEDIYKAKRQALSQKTNGDACGSGCEKLVNALGL